MKWLFLTSVIGGMLGLFSVNTYAQGNTPPEDLPKNYNPKGLYAPSRYSQVGEVPEGMRILFFSGMVSQDASGFVLNEGNFEQQVHTIFANLQVTLLNMGLGWKHVVKLNYYIVDYRPEMLEQLNHIRFAYLPRDHRPASTLVGVTALYSPKVLVEIEAIVAAPAEKVAEPAEGSGRGRNRSRN